MKNMDNFSICETLKETAGNNGNCFLHEVRVNTMIDTGCNSLFSY